MCYFIRVLQRSCLVVVQGEARRSHRSELNIGYNTVMQFKCKFVFTQNINGVIINFINVMLPVCIFSHAVIEVHYIMWSISKETCPAVDNCC